MRGWRSILVALASLVIVTVAWEKEDHELFDLVRALEASEGKGTTFYKFLNITKSATTAEINKAARRRSLELHPDKNPGDKTIQERFARLGLIAAILRDQEKRERYNFFHDNGVPIWKGTGYMYSRWQPGLGFVMSFIFVVASLVQYGIQHVTYRQELLRIEKFRKAAQWSAYGGTLKKNESSGNGTNSTTTTNGASGSGTAATTTAATSGLASTTSTPLTTMRRKVKVPLNVIKSQGSLEGGRDDDEEGVTSSSRSARRRAGANSANSGPMISMVVEGDKVWIVTETGQELPLDATVALKPSLSRTFIPQIIKSSVVKLIPARSTSLNDQDSSTALVDESEMNGNGDGLLTPSNGDVAGPDVVGKVGGVRKRKVKGKKA